MIETLNTLLNDLVGELGATIAITLLSILWPSVIVLARLAYQKLAQWLKQQAPDYLDPLIDSVAFIGLNYAEQLYTSGKIEKDARMQAALDAAERRLAVLGVQLPRQVIQDTIEALLARLEAEGTIVVDNFFSPDGTLG